MSGAGWKRGLWQRRKPIVALIVHTAILSALLCTDAYTYRPVTRAFQDWRKGSNPILRRLSGAATWRTFNDMGEAITAIAVAIVIWQLDARRRKRLLVLVIGGVAASAIAGTMTTAIGRMRPEITHGRPRYLALGERWTNRRIACCPSGHATAGAALATYVGLAYPPLRGVMAVMAVGCGVARVRYFKHYLGDVYAGLMLGHFVMLWVWYALRRRKGRIPEHAPGDEGPPSGRTAAAYEIRAGSDDDRA